MFRLALKLYSRSMSTSSTTRADPYWLLNRLVQLKKEISAFRDSFDTLVTLGLDKKELEELVKQEGTPDEVKTLARDESIVLSTEIKAKFKCFNDYMKSDGIDNDTVIKEATIESQEEDNSYPPKLLAFKNPELNKKVFTHRSVDPKLFDNGRLEFIGDSILNHITTEIIFKRYPDANEGQLTKLRQHIVNNDNLVKWSTLYNFDDKLDYIVDDKLQFLNGKQKIYADTFEVYIGGLYIDDNYSSNRVGAWLSSLINHKLDEFDRFEKSSAARNKAPKTVDSNSAPSIAIALENQPGKINPEPLSIKRPSGFTSYKEPQHKKRHLEGPAPKKSQQDEAILIDDEPSDITLTTAQTSVRTSNGTSSSSNSFPNGYNDTLLQSSVYNPLTTTTSQIPSQALLAIPATEPDQISSSENINHYSNDLYAKINPFFKVDYPLLSREGQDNSPLFTVGCAINNELLGVGKFSNIKTARQLSARDAFLNNNEKVEKYIEFNKLKKKNSAVTLPSPVNMSLNDQIPYMYAKPTAEY
ncbi:hypothetical protein WICMUC_005510 [Wickerhamomyces mucosus]|uniref:ribonuclease III n=1 Tax=Wickerhamomyces mucosus TaxID=1378264 RepID=A0A9P8T570_9ASCO|nr:hypothetical protein WICMUC_005510 [Wickerhamomyces mucosus]